VCVCVCVGGGAVSPPRCLAVATSRIVVLGVPLQEFWERAAMRVAASPHKVGGAEIRVVYDAFAGK
jgi:hypothetical protein